MTGNEELNALLPGLDRLMPLTPDAARAARVRAACHARLMRSRRRAQERTAVSQFGRRVVAPAVVLGVCGLYLASMVGFALRLRQLL